MSFLIAAEQYRNAARRSSSESKKQQSTSDNTLDPDRLKQWFFNQFEILCNKDNNNDAEILRSIFHRLRTCHSALLHTEILSIFGSLIERRPYIIAGCNIKLSQIVLNMIPHIEQEYNDAEKMTLLSKLLRGVVEGQYEPAVSRLLLSTLCDIMTSSSSNEPESYFDFSNPDCGIILPPFKTEGWPYPKGYTFSLWLRLANVNEDRYLLSCHTDHGHGVDIYFEKQTSSLCINVNTGGNKHAIVVPNKLCQINPRQWHCLTITHSKKATTFSLGNSGLLRVVVDNRRVWRGSLAYPRVQGVLRHNSLCMNVLHLESSSKTCFCGQIGNIYMFGDALDDDTISTFVRQGPKFNIEIELVSTTRSGWFKTLFKKQFNSLMNAFKFASSTTSTTVPLESKTNNNNNNNNVGNLTKEEAQFKNAMHTIVFAYHPKCIEDGIVVVDLIQGNNTLHMRLNGRMKPNVRICCRQSLCEVIYRGIGGITSLFPLFRYIQELSGGNVSNDDVSSVSLLPQLIRLVTYILAAHRELQEQMLDIDGFATLSYLIGKYSLSNDMCEGTLSAIEESIQKASWMMVKAPNHDDFHTTVSSSSSSSSSPSQQQRRVTDAFHRTNPNIPLEYAKKRTLFNDIFIYLLLDFKIWHRHNVDHTIQYSMVRLVNTYIQRYPVYFRSLITIQHILDELRRHLQYNETNMKHVWIVRSHWFTAIKVMILKGTSGTLAFKDIQVLVEYLSDCKDALYVSEILELLAELLMISPKFMYKYLMKLGGFSIPIMHLQGRFVHIQHVQVAIIHLMNGLLQCKNISSSPSSSSYTPPGLSTGIELFLLSSNSSLGLYTYYALLELALALKPGTLGINNGIQAYITTIDNEKQEIINEKTIEKCILVAPTVLRSILASLYNNNNNNEQQEQHRLGPSVVFEDILLILHAHTRNISAFAHINLWQSHLIEYYVKYYESEWSTHTKTILTHILAYVLKYETDGWLKWRETMSMLSIAFDDESMNEKRRALIISVLECLEERNKKWSFKVASEIINHNIAHVVDYLEECIYFESSKWSFTAVNVNDDDKSWILCEQDDTKQQEHQEQPTKIDIKHNWKIVRKLVQVCMSIGVSLKPHVDITGGLHSQASIWDNLRNTDVLSSNHYSKIRTGGPLRVILRLLFKCIEEFACELNMDYMNQVLMMISLLLETLWYEREKSHHTHSINRYVIWSIHQLKEIYETLDDNNYKHTIHQTMKYLCERLNPITATVNTSDFRSIIIDVLNTHPNQQEQIEAISNKFFDPTNALILLPLFINDNNDIVINDMLIQQSPLVHEGICKNVMNDIEQIANVIRKLELKFLSEYLAYNSQQQGQMRKHMRTQLETSENDWKVLQRQTSLISQSLNYSEINRRIIAEIKQANVERRGYLRWKGVLESGFFTEIGGWATSSSNNNNNMNVPIIWGVDVVEDKLRMRRKLTRIHDGSQHLDASKHVERRSSSSDDSATDQFPVHISHLRRLSITNTMSSLQFEEENDCDIIDDDLDSDGSSSRSRGVSIASSSLDGWEMLNNNNNNNNEASTSIRFMNRNGLIHSSLECVLIHPIDLIEGRLDIYADHISFVPAATNNHIESSPTSQDDEHKYRLESLQSQRQLLHQDHQWSVTELHAVYRRRYQLQRTALEIFLKNGTNYLINFSSRDERSHVLRRILQLNPPNLVKVCSRTPTDLLKRLNVTQRWQKREISNFEYIMQLNTISGRSFNDLNQYPVFPWIFNSFNEEDDGNINILEVALSMNPTSHKDTESVFRDLSQPIGALNPSRLAQILERFNTFADTDIPPFHYGSHYSNAGIVLFYLMRLEPFASLHIELQAGKFDFPDRLFTSIQQTWKNCLTSLSCFKELTPEFFYLPEIFENINNYALGNKQDGTRVNNVNLPSWARTSEDFIRLHRLGLESEYVSQNLHHWIDLIFGYKQRGMEAIKANNLFFHLTYEGAVDVNAINDPVLVDAVKQQIAQFGQTPLQLFTKPHPSRLPLQECSNLYDIKLKRLLYRWELKSSSMNNIHHLSFHHPILKRIQASRYDSILSISPFNEHIYAISSNFHITSHPWSTDNVEPTSKLPFVFDINARATVQCPNRPVSAALAWSWDSKYLYIGNIYDGSLRIYQTSVIKSADRIEVRCQQICCKIGHNDRITCIDIAVTNKTLVTASIDCSIVVWSIEMEANTLVNVFQRTIMINPLVKYVLTGHLSTVLSLSINVEMDVCVSYSSLSNILIHSLRNGTFVRKLELPNNDNNDNHHHHHRISVQDVLVTNEGSIILYVHQCDSTMKLWRCSVNGRYWTSQEIQIPLTSISTSYDGQLLVTGDEHGDVVLRRSFDLSIVQLFESINSAITSVRMSADSQYILTGSKSGHIFVMAVL